MTLETDDDIAAIKRIAVLAPAPMMRLLHSYGEARLSISRRMT